MRFDEGSTLEGFGHEVSDHLLCGTVLHGQVTMGDVVGDEKVVHVKMFCALGTQQSAILFKKDGTLIVLMKDGLVKIETLSMEKIVCPK